jgi:Tetratricopeptide Repeats-Sensor
MADPEPALRPVCFMVMPFRKKKVPEPKPPGAPAEVDCDALWDKAFRPAIEQLGYEAVRADYDAGTVIVKDMLERLAFADLVLADVSLPNGNVYYEVGLRHVARETSCILLAASWSRQLFDIDQFTSIRFALTDGGVPDEEAAAIRAKMIASVPALKDSRTPYYEFIAGAEDDQKRRGVFRDQVSRLAAFQARVREARLLADRDRRRARIEEIERSVTGAALELADVAIELMCLLRDYVGWPETVTFIDGLPKVTRELPVVQEQYLLAKAKVGSPEEAIARLEELIAAFGDSAERQGLLGGRYKQLWRDARKARTEAGQDRPSLHEKRQLGKAIEHYTRGMELDYNAFYCSSNLPPLLRARAKEGDVERARIVEHFVVAACERALARNEDDGWVRPTLLGAAFRAGDVAKAEELAERVAEEGVAAWKLDTTLADAKDAVAATADPAVRKSLEAVVAELEELAQEA